MINHGAKWPPVVPHTWYRQAAAIENTCSVAECNSSCVSGYGGGQYSTVFTDPIHSRTNSTLAAKLYKAKKNKGLQMVPGWSPDGTIQRAIQSCSESSILASLCGSAAETYPTTFFSCGIVCLPYFRLFIFKKLVVLEKNTKKTLCWRFLDQLQPIGPLFFRAV